MVEVQHFSWRRVACLSFLRLAGCGYGQILSLTEFVGTQSK